MTARNGIEVLIPAAGRVPEGILGLANVTCVAMIPVAGRPVVFWTLEYLRSLGLRRFRIAVPRRGLFVEDFVECAAGDGATVRFLVPSRDGGVGLTVLELAEQSEGASALVVLGDTLFRFRDPAVLGSDGPFVLVSRVEESYRWCLATANEKGELAGLRDKEVGVPGDLEALIGVYYFPDLDEFRDAARAAVGEAEAQGKPAELAAILRRIPRPIGVQRADDWLDCGNPDRQAASHQALLQKRAFNELTVDPTFGTITKRSRHVDKFIDEINYYRLIPKELAVLFPRALDYSVDWERPFLTLEYYGYPSLAEMFVFENIDPGIWERVFLHLREIVVKGFMRFRTPLPAGAIQDVYLEKTRRRLEGLTGPPELVALIGSPGTLSINRQEIRNLPLVWEEIERRVEALAAGATGSVIHGDLCFSNILYDLRSRVCKLVDPRGSFGRTGIYGDPRYDVAKLYHSVLGLYDFIMNDLFTVSVAGKKAELAIRSLPQHAEIRDRFEKVFFPTFDRDEILLITALLFASMPALHYDAPRRQVAMYVRGLQLLNELLGDGNDAADTAQPPRERS